MSNERAKNAYPIKDRYLAFNLCSEQYAIPLLKVREVIAVPTITPVPHTPAHFKGIMNLRGQIVSVVDLRVKLRMSKADFTPETVIIVLDLANVSLGIVVDRVISVLSLLPEEISATPAVESNVAMECIAGVSRKDNKLTFLLDIERTVDLKALQNHLKTHSNASAA